MYQRITHSARWLVLIMGMALWLGSISINATQAQVNADGRLNANREAGAALYCRSDGGIDVYRLSLSSPATFAFSVTGSQLVNAISQATSSGNLVVIATQSDIRLAALANGLVEIQSNRLNDPSRLYTETVPATSCGATVAPPPQPPTPQPPQPPPTGGTTYVVQSGDTLARIAQRFGVTLNALIAANNIINPSLIFPGQVLIIPGGYTPPPTPPPTTGTTYVVQSGDTLFKIAQRFGVTLSALIAANTITNPSRIYVGQVLTIPAHTTPPPVSTYTVQAGDTLAQIASRFGVSLRALISVNGITNPSRIEVGQVLTLPYGNVAIQPVTYIVQRGDSLSKIARNFGSTVQAIASANNIANVSRIEVGQVLVIP